MNRREADKVADLIRATPIERHRRSVPKPPQPLRLWLDALAPLLLILAACAVAICVAQIVAPTPGA